VKDDVHEEDVPWRYEVTVRDVQALLAQKGFAGIRLKDIRIASHTESGRVGSLRLSGLEPDVIAGDQFRLLVGARDLKSTAFSVEKHGDRLEFTGRGYGHGVGMCVVGAGRRARRGESVRAILAQYYPGLALTSLDSLPPRFKTDVTLAANPPGPAPTPSPAPPPRAASSATAPTVPASTTAPAVIPAPAERAVARPTVAVRGATSPADLQPLAVRAQEAMAKALGTAVAPITIEAHESVESFRQATGKPWWVSASVSGGIVDLAPLALLTQRDGIEMTLRNAIAQTMMAAELNGRPEWVRAGAGRYFSRQTPLVLPDPRARVKCPADAELNLAISAVAQREAESRAEICFARAYAATKNWRDVR
jgi:hypothetical protein